jgi:predicted RNA polymerase sigma factor
MRADPSPIVELNRAVAVAMRDGPDMGLELVDELLAGSGLANYHLSHAAQADLCRRLGQKVMHALLTSAPWPSPSRNRTDGIKSDG